MKTLITILLAIITLGVIEAKPKHLSPTYQCKHIGLQKIKPFKFNDNRRKIESIKRRLYYANTKSNLRYRI